ncbi:MAG: hypothetical protein AB7V26_00660 [Lysobacterales bacterium]
MANGRSESPSEREQRRELGGYSDAEFEAAMLRSQRGDRASLALRILTLALVFTLMARSILHHHTPAWLLVLPLIVEWLVIFWLGQALARWRIDCKAFRRSAGGLGLTLGWTLAFALLALGFAGYDEGTSTWQLAQIGDGLSSGRQQALAAGMHWVILVAVGGLALSTWVEWRQWRRVRGVFVWTSIMQTGFRLAVMLLLGIVAVFLLAMFGSSLPAGFFGRSSPALAWAVFAFLLLCELLTLVIATLMLREAAAKAKSGRSAVH